MDEHPDNQNLPITNRPATILGVTITFLLVAIIAISIRLYVRFKDRLWGWDDGFVFLAGVGSVVGASITCLMPDDGLGRHFWTLDERTIMNYFKHIWSTNVTYCATTTFIKLSILHQYLRLFDMQSRVARMLIWSLIYFTTCWGITFFFLALFSCTPIAKNWNFSLEGKCVAWGSKNPNEFFATWAAHSASNMMLDILVLILPIPFLRRLRMGGKTRMGLIGLFTMGGIVAMLSLARIVALSIRRAGTVPVIDMTFYTPAVYIFSVLEVNIAIVCASIPIFWPLVSSLAANKILVVNEVQVHTERRSSQNIALAEQGGNGGGFSGITDLDTTEEREGRTSRTSISAGGKGDTKIGLSRTNSRPARSTSTKHRHKPSSSSLSKGLASIGIELGNRHSGESQRKLNLTHQNSNHSLSLSGSPEQRDGPLEVTRKPSIAHYQDRYVQDWVIPDFDKGNAVGGGTTTTVERAEIPFDHIKAFEK